MAKDVDNIKYEYTYKPNFNPWRSFVSEMWFKHRDEILLWTNKTVIDYDAKDYFQKNKWFLKEKFKKEIYDSKNKKR